jgi:hypothetical protein
VEEGCRGCAREVGRTDNGRWWKLAGRRAAGGTLPSPFVIGATDETFFFRFSPPQHAVGCRHTHTELRTDSGPHALSSPLSPTKERHRHLGFGRAAASFNVAGRQPPHALSALCWLHPTLVRSSRNGEEAGTSSITVCWHCRGRATFPAIAAAPLFVARNRKCPYLTAVSLSFFSHSSSLTYCHYESHLSVQLIFGPVLQIRPPQSVSIQIYV